jgi:hypothetical protein
MATLKKPTSLFVRLQNELTGAGITARTEESQKWYMNRVRKITRINEATFLRDPNLLRKNRFFPGYMYHFVYDAKNKDVLPYYDTFPLIIAVQPAPGGFYGLNLHYLHPMTRALFLDKLMVIANKPEFDEKTRLKLNYNIVSSGKRFKEFKPCFKHYLFEQIDSRIMMVPSQEWETAIFLPTERFENASKRTVWRQSKNKILGI